MGVAPPMGVMMRLPLLPISRRAWMRWYSMIWGVRLWLTICWALAWPSASMRLRSASCFYFCSTKAIFWASWSALILSLMDLVI